MLVFPGMLVFGPWLFVGAGRGSDQFQSLDGGVEDSPGCFNIGVDGGHSSCSRVELHLQVDSGGYGCQLGQSGASDDAVVQGFTVDHQESGFDLPRGLPFPEGDNQLDVTPWFSGSSVETLKV